MSQGTEGAIALAKELLESREEVANHHGRRKAMDVMQRAAEWIARMAPLDPDIEAEKGEN